MRYQFLVIAALAAVTLAPATASAQSARVEISGIVGWTISDGIETASAVPCLGGSVCTAIDLKDSFSWGFGVGINATENAEVGFLFNQQMSTLGVEGTAGDTEIGDIKVNSYHPYFAYNFGESDATVRPFFLLGLGATNYGSVAYSRPGRVGETDTATKFSSTWALGVKVFPSPNVGLRVAASWTPTYISSDSAGYWCDPYWGCYVVGDAKYSNQFHLNGGVTFRF